MRHRLRFCVLTICLVLTLVVAGCGPAEPTAQQEETVKETSEVKEAPTQAPTAEVPEEHHLAIGVELDQSLWDPQWTYQPSYSDAWHCVFDTLVWYDDNMNIIPWLAESWEMESDTEWVFTLRKEVKFHNGEQFNAEAVKYNVERATAEGYQRWKFLAPLSGAEVLDEYTVKIILHDPNATFLGLMTMFLMLPPEYTQQVGEEGFRAAPVGSGPYKFVEHVADSHALLERNDDYWNGTPEFATITWRTIPETSTRLAALLAGEINLARQISPDQVETVEANPGLKVVSRESVRTPYIPIFPDSPMGGGEPLQDVRVRKALNHAIDRDAIVEYLLKGMGTPVATLLTPSMLGYANLEYEYDPEKARALLAEAGYPDGFTIQQEVAYNMTMPKPVEIASKVAADLAAVGVKVDLHVREQSVMLEKQRNRSWAPLAMWSYGATPLDPDMKFWGAFGEKGSMHFISSPELNELIYAGRATQDIDERKEIYQELDRMVYDEALCIALFAQHDIWAGQDSLEFKSWANETMYVPGIRVLED